LIWHRGLYLRVLLWFWLCGVKFCTYGFLHGFVVCLIFASVLAHSLGWYWKSLIMSYGLVVSSSIWFRVDIHGWILWFSFPSLVSLVRLSDYMNYCYSLLEDWQSFVQRSWSLIFLYEIFLPFFHFMSFKYTFISR